MNNIALDIHAIDVKPTRQGQEYIWENPNARLYTVLTEGGEELQAISYEGIQFMQVIGQELKEMEHDILVKVMTRNIFITPSIRHKLNVKY